jgi:hypothetical protein
MHGESFIRYSFNGVKEWHGRQESNPQRTVLEAVALPVELRPFGVSGRQKNRPSRKGEGGGHVTTSAVSPAHSGVELLLVTEAVGQAREAETRGGLAARRQPSRNVCRVPRHLGLLKLDLSSAGAFPGATQRLRLSKPAHNTFSATARN